jgi:hypothetical protein
LAGARLVESFCVDTIDSGHIFGATMKTALTILLFLVVFSGSVVAQRSVTGDSLVDEFRPDGELRMWTFVVKDSTIGRLFSTVKGRTTIDGIDAYIIEQRLGLDFSRHGSGVTIDIEGRQFVGDNGGYLGCELSIKTGDQVARLEIERDGDTLRGEVEQSGRSTDLQQHFDVNGFAADVYLLDLHELFLAMRDIRVGDTIRDTLFVPQLMLKQYVEATVDLFVNKEIYKGKFDSSFVITYSYPRRQAFYFTPDKRLVKVEIPGQQLKAYLDVVRKFDPLAKGPSATSPTLGNLIERLPVFLAYFALGLIAAVFYVGRGWRWSVAWIGLVAGGLLYGLVTVTQMPLQMYLVENLFIPSIAEGGSPYLWGMFPALTAGIIQELLIAGLILGFAFLAKVRADRLAVIGAVCGAGFGIVEGCYLVTLASNVDVLSWHLLERGFTILFHATAGALLGRALAHGSADRRFRLTLIAMILFNTVLRYLPVFVQQRVIMVQMMYFLIPLLVVGLTGFALWRFKRVG